MSMSASIDDDDPMEDGDRDSSSTAPSKGRSRAKPGERRLQILQALAQMLERPSADRVTTAALAARLQVSEAALYRHFASKAQMFEGLIEFIESSIFSLINQIQGSDLDGRGQVRSVLTLLIKFAESNPGMTRVLIGDALVNEDERLQARINLLLDRIESSLKQSYRTSLAGEGGDTDRDAQARAAIAIAYVLGRWGRYAKSGFKKAPAAGFEAQLPFLLP